MKNIIFSIFLLTLFCACVEGTKKENLKDHIQGSWISINAEKAGTNQFPGEYGIPFGLNFEKDNVDFFRQFTSYKRDSITNKMKFNAFAGFVPYQLKADSLFIMHPLHNTLEFKYTIDTSQKDILLLKRNDSLLHTLERLPKLEKNTIAFDQVVFSRSGCFGRCPIMNIAIKKNGDVSFYGEEYTDIIGFYKATLTPEFTNYLFQKFEDINISKVADAYKVSHTDDETVTTTFVQDGKIIKTVQDYGKAGTKELLWAYQAIENVYKQLQLTAVTIEETTPKLNHYSFEKDATRLLLKKSESFLLWEALKNGQTTTNSFKKVYIFDTSYYRNEFIKAESDGQFYKLYFKNGKITTYDIGYNYISRNFKKADFKKMDKSQFD